jgi:hypothetical protein
MPKSNQELKEKIVGNSRRKEKGTRNKKMERYRSGWMRKHS